MKKCSAQIIGKTCLIYFGCRNAAITSGCNELGTGFTVVSTGLGLTFVHLNNIPFTDLLINPARITCDDMFTGEWKIKHLWLLGLELFWLEYFKILYLRMENNYGRY